ARHTIGLEGAGPLISASPQAGSCGLSPYTTLFRSNVMVTGGGVISSATSGLGKGGTARVTASDAIGLDGAGSVITASTQAGSSGIGSAAGRERKKVTVAGGALSLRGRLGWGKGRTE